MQVVILDPAPGQGMPVPPGGRVAVLGGDPWSLGAAANLLRAGVATTLWVPAGGEEAVAPLLEMGATTVSTPASAAAVTDVVLHRAADLDSARAVLVGGEPGAPPGVDAAVAGCRPSTVVVELSALGPRDARALGIEVQRHGPAYLEAALGGSTRQAQEGTLACYVGGDPETLEAVRDVLEAFTAPGRLTWVGDLGAGASARVVTVAAAAAAWETVGEVLRLGRDLDLGRTAVLEVLRSSPLASLITQKDRRLREQDAGGDEVPVVEPLAEVLAELSVALRYAAAALPALEGAFLAARLHEADGRGGDDVVALALRREGLDGEPGVSP